MPIGQTTEDREFLTVLADWEEAKRNLEHFKNLEIQLRNEIAQTFEPSSEEEGTRTHELANDWKLKCVFKMNRTLIQKDNVLEDALVELEQTFDDGKSITDRLVTFKPSLSKTEYDRLTEEQRDIFDKAVQTKAATPTVTLVPPKG